MKKEDEPSAECGMAQHQNNDTLNSYENGREVALKSFAELMKRIENAEKSLETARTDKDLVTFVYWFVLIHEYRYMLNAILMPDELQMIYDEIEQSSPRDYLVHKKKQHFVRLPDCRTVYGRGYNFPDIIGCALDNRCAEEILTFVPDTDGILVCGGQLKRQNLMLQFLQTGAGKEQTDFCDVCGKNLNDQPYPYSFRCDKCGRIFNLCRECSEDRIHKNWGPVGQKPADRYEDAINQEMFQGESNMEQTTISQQFADMYYLELKEGRRVRTSEFLATVNSVLSRIRQDYLFNRVVKDSAIKFVCNDERVTTMCIDDRNNVYVSVNYLVQSLNMDEELIYALFLNAYNTISSHSLDEEKKFLDDGMPSGSMIFQMMRPKERPAVQLTRPVHHDINIALDIRANSLVLRNDSITTDLLANKMNAVYANSTVALTLSGYFYHKMMNKWREDIGYTFPLAPSVRPRPDTFSSGYVYTMRYLNELIKVYDKEEALSLAANVTMRE